jgi:hypothetical protein
MSPHIDPFEELAELFLTEPDGHADANGRTATGSAQGTGGTVGRESEVELIVVGSLPVRATLWLVPYADAVARELGPTGLIRLDDETATLQVLRAGPDVRVGPWPSLREAIADLSPCIGRWVIRPALEVAPGDLASEDGPRITVLSSANEGAIVDAYQRVKALVEAARASGAGRPTVGLAVLGAERQRAERVQQQLNRTTTSFLEVELPLVACVQRMDAAIRASDCVTFSTEPKPPIRSVLRWIREATAALEAPAHMPAATVGTDLAEGHPVEPRHPDAVRLAPKPGVRVEPKEPIAALEPDEVGAPVSLAAYIDELIPLAVRCPGHERLEIGIDPAGRLHVIARDEQLRELHVVEAWASAHRELIGQAPPDVWVDPAARTISHVFTDEPANVADLQGSALRLHVLAPVIVDGRQGWYAAPLNAAVR